MAIVTSIPGCDGVAICPQCGCPDPNGNLGAVVTITLCGPIGDPTTFTDSLSLSGCGYGWNGTSEDGYIGLNVTCSAGTFFVSGGINGLSGSGFGGSTPVSDGEITGGGECTGEFDVIASFSISLSS